MKLKIVIILFSLSITWLVSLLIYLFKVSPYTTINQDVVMACIFILILMLLAFSFSCITDIINFIKKEE